MSELTPSPAFSSTVASCPVDVAFGILFQQVCLGRLCSYSRVSRANSSKIRTIYLDLSRTVELEREQLKLKVEELTHQYEAQRVQYEARLAESRADRAEAIANDKQNTLVIRNHLLQVPRFAAPALKGELHPLMLRPELISTGSASRAETWRSAKKAHSFVRRKLPTKPAIVEAMRTRTAAKIDVMLAKRYSNETLIYQDFLDVLNQALPDLASFHDTSNNPFLSGQKPDLTLATPGAVKPEPDIVSAVIEVKKTDVRNLESDKDLGQVFDYLVAMFVEQPGRRNFTGILSSVGCNIVVCVEVGESGWTIVQHNNSNIYETFAYLSETALVEHSHLPPSPGFVYSDTNMRRRLGNPRHCVVGEFPVKGKPGLVMAIKRYANPAVEIYYLHTFASMNSRPESIPLLCYVAPDESEFGITPVGAPLVPGVFANQEQAQVILTDVLEALIWLHALGIVHRDVRCENVVIAFGGHGVLIDFDAACDFRRGSAPPWRGGYICCPPWHVRQVIARNSDWATTLYCPGPSGDWYAWVLLANCLMFPTAFAGFQSHLVGATSAESRRLLTLWDALQASKVWGPFVDAATGCKVEVLRKLPEMFTWL